MTLESRSEVRHVKIAALLVATAVVAATGAADVRARPDALLALSSRTLVVGYSSDAALKQALARVPARLVRQLPSLRAVELRPRNPRAAAVLLAAQPGIEYVEAPASRRPLVEPALVPAEVPGGAYQWQYAVTRAHEVPAQVARRALTVTIAVVDSGADVSAPDLEAKRPATYNTSEGTTDVKDVVGHGTFVSSLAAGSATNGEGIAGMGGEARLFVLKAGGGMFTDFDVAAAITMAVDRGAKIVNLSLGGVHSTNTELRALRYAAAKDVLLVAAAGNEYMRGNPVSYPAAHLQPLGSNGQGGIGLSVGASSWDGTRAPFSNTGSYISLAAPGHDVFAAISKDSSPKHFPRVALPGSHAGFYGYSSGTSFSAPQVAGAAALVWGANPRLSARQVSDILKSTASGGGSWNPQLGYGVINVAAAVEQARVTPGVTLRVYKSGTKAYLQWLGSLGAKTYRLLVRVDDGPERVVLERTPSFGHTFEGPSGRTHTFRVESLDAAGNVIASSASLIATLGRSPAAIALKAYRFKYRGKRHVVLLAVLEPKAIDTRAGSRLIWIERRERGRWRIVGTAFTDAGGRAAWFVPPGRHQIRGRHGGTYDVAEAVSRPLVVRGP